MKEFKITGYVKIGFSKIIECESREEAMKIVEQIAYTEGIDSYDMNDWIDEVKIEDAEEKDDVEDSK